MTHTRKQIGLLFVMFTMICTCCPLAGAMNLNHMPGHGPYLNYDDQQISIEEALAIMESKSVELMLMNGFKIIDSIENLDLVVHEFSINSTVFDADFRFNVRADESSSVLSLEVNGTFCSSKAQNGLSLNFQLYLDHSSLEIHTVILYDIECSLSGSNFYSSEENNQIEITGEDSEVHHFNRENYTEAVTAPGVDTVDLWRTTTKDGEWSEVYSREEEEYITDDQSLINVYSAYTDNHTNKVTQGSYTVTFSDHLGCAYIDYLDWSILNNGDEIEVDLSNSYFVVSGVGLENGQPMLMEAGIKFDEGKSSYMLTYEGTMWINARGFWGFVKSVAKAVVKTAVAVVVGAVVGGAIVASGGTVIVATTIVGGAIECGIIGGLAYSATECLNSMIGGGRQAGAGDAHAISRAYIETPNNTNLIGESSASLVQL